MMNTYSCKGAKPNLASVIFNALTRALGEMTTISPRKTTYNGDSVAVFQEPSANVVFSPSPRLTP